MSSETVPAYSNKMGLQNTKPGQTYPNFTGKSAVKYVLSHALNELGYLQSLPLNGDSNEVPVMVPEENMGDFSSQAALQIAKILKKNPAKLAEEIVKKALHIDAKDPYGQKREKYFESINQKNGFINFRLSKNFLFSELGKILEHGNLYGAGIWGDGEKILLEYFQPNVAKPLHLGHLRTAIIGDSLFRILSSQGFKVESDTHLGDWGTQFGLLILAYKKYGDISLIEKDPINELNKLYVKINSEIEQNPSLREEGKAEFVKLEKGDEENRKLWKQFRDWSWKEYEVVYRDLEIRKSDHDWPESFYEDKMPAVVKALKEKGILKESQGAQIVDLEEHGLGVAVVVKSDGGTTYLLRDLATYIYRKEQGFKRQLYVVDVRQSHTLKQTFKILELLGNIENQKEAEHVAYGFLTLPEGAMSTRKGTVVGATDFIKGVQESALKIIEEKNPDLKNKQEVATKVAAGALKYFDLSHNLKSDIVFDPKKAISFEGNTGPYLQYTHARIQGILKKHEVRNPKFEKYVYLEIQKEESTVLRKLQYFSEIVRSSAESLLPNILANYLFELAQSFNAFYQEVPVLQEQNEEFKNFRLALITATAQVLQNGLYLLGIEAPEEM